MRIRRFWRIIEPIAVGLGFVILLGAAAAAWMLHVLDRESDPCGAMHSFSSERWRRIGPHAATGAPDRACIASDLLARGYLVGHTPREVADSLGLPTSRTWEGAPALVYYLGPQRGAVALGSLWLVLRLGPDGRVVQQAVSTLDD